MDQRFTPISRPHAAWPWGVWTFAASGTLLMAWTLGASWLGHSVMGVPLGVWALTLGLGLAGVMSRRWPGLTTADLIAWLTPMTWRLAETTERTLRAAAVLLVGENRAAQWLQRVAAHLDRVPWWESPLRLGIDAPQPQATALIEQSGRADVLWFEVTSAAAQDNPNAFCERHGLDALVTSTPDGSLRVVTLRRDGFDAAMADWTVSRSVNLGTLFPHAADPAVVELPAAGSQSHRAAVEFIAALARSPRRLSLADRLAGRRPMPRPTRLRALRPIDQRRTDTPAQLAERLVDSIERTGVDPASRSLLDAVSTWSASQTIDLVGCDDYTPRELLERIARRCPSCPVTHLRLAAARFAARDDRGGLDALALAYPTLRQTARPTDAPLHAMFLDDALKLSTDEPSAVGRVAVGLALLMAATPEDQLDYLRDDLLDEARFADWLIGRDPDTTLLDHVHRRLSQLNPQDPKKFPRRAA